MGLPADQLGTDERVVDEMREHWKHLLGTGAICLAAFVGLLLVLGLAPDTGWLAWLDGAAWVGFVVVLAVFGVWPGLRWWTKTYTVTNQRLATRSGVFRRRGRDIPLGRINDVAFQQGVLDRMVGAGTLRVSAASEDGTVVLTDVPHVHEVSRQLGELVRAVRDPRP
ncbi:MAG TPA: PH domain-containing protein [Dermatophilaceae bacterium]|nr:PH domain-containing protein [Dermatophilaceae bacterium]